MHIISVRGNKGGHFEKETISHIQEKEKKKKSFIFDQVMKAATLLTNAVSNLDDAMSTEGVGKQLDNIEGACAALRDWVK